MDEAAKTGATRPPWFYERYMGGTVLDIGCGTDLVVPHAVPFDEMHGDANEVLSYFQPRSFDCVHSSHCLEHMRDPCRVVRDWWALVRAGGYMIIVVPDEDLYEQRVWPSRFNDDHKHTFRLAGSSSWSPASHNIVDLVEGLPDVEILSAQRHDRGYVHQPPILPIRFPLTIQKLVSRVHNRLRRYHRLAGTLLERTAIRVALAANCPIDQTLGGALAQIEIVARRDPGPVPLQSGLVDVERHLP